MANELAFVPYQEVEVVRGREAGAEPFRARLLTRVGEYLLLDRPRRSGPEGGEETLDAVEVNEIFEIHFEHDGAVYRCKARVAKVSRLPFFHLCLEFKAAAVRRTEIRAVPRYRGLVPVLLSARRKDGEPVLLSRRAYLVDVALKGVGLLSENRVPRRFLLTLETAADCCLQLKCRVRRVKEQPVVRDFFYYGCEIEELSRPDRFREYLDFLAAAAGLFAAPGPPAAVSGDPSVKTG